MKAGFPIVFLMICLQIYPARLTGANPHAHIYIDVRTDGGVAEHWNVELEPREPSSSRDCREIGSRPVRR